MDTGSYKFKTLCQKYEDFRGPAFDIAVVSPWADARTFTANVAGGDSVDNAVKDLNAQVENNLKLK